MKFILYITLFSILSCAALKAQTARKYSDIDTLLNTNSVIDAMSALKTLKENFTKDTVDAQYWLRFSKASYTLYKYDDAKAAINKAVQLSPRGADLYYEKGILYNKLGELEPALTALEKAVSLETNGDYFYWKGIVNQQLNHNDAAESDYEKAIGLKIERPELFNNLALLLSEKGNYERALTMIHKAIALNKNYSQAYSARSKIYFFMLNLDSACVDKNTAANMGYRKAFMIPDSICNGNDRKQWQYAADILAASDLYKPAIKAYTKLIYNNLLHADYFLNRGYCYYKLKDYSNAEKDYLRALTMPGAATDLIYDNLSLLYYDQNQFLKSIEYASKRIELNPKNEVPYIDRGLCYRKLKKYKEAEKDFNQSLELKPDFFRAFGYRAFLYLELGDYLKAQEDAVRSVELNPKYGYGYLVLAQTKQKLGVADFCVDLYNAVKYEEREAEQAIKEFCK